MGPEQRKAIVGGAGPGIGAATAVYFYDRGLSFSA